MIKFLKSLFKRRPSYLDYLMAKPPELTIEQRAHNHHVEMEIAIADHEEKTRDEMEKRKIKEWQEFLLANPNYPYKACPHIRLTRRPRKIYIKYVI